jgi:hypothetical protein
MAASASRRKALTIADIKTEEPTRGQLMRECLTVFAQNNLSIL